MDCLLQTKAYIEGTFELVKNLPEEIQQLPGAVSPLLRLQSHGIHERSHKYVPAPSSERACAAMHACHVMCQLYSMELKIVDAHLQQVITALQID